MTLLTVQGLHKSFARRGWFGRDAAVLPAVRDVSFELPAGGTLALIGESGAGKSTVARLVARLIEPDAGSVSFDGEDVLSLAPEPLRRLRARMQMVFQDPYGSLDPRMSIGAAVGEPLLVHDGLNRRERERQVAGLLERVGLPPAYLTRKPRELSGGQLQRAAIARALATRPRLILCDEPVAALDLLVRAQVLNMMKDLQAEFGMAYLFITHDLGLVRAFADSVAVMRRGEIVERGSVEAVFARPRHDYTRELLQAIPSLVPKNERPVSQPERASGNV